ncbi:MAG: hypothetical protein M1835_002476, partial [Candelina submexicana]
MASGYSTPRDLSPISSKQVEIRNPTVRPHNLPQDVDNDSIGLSGSMEIAREKTQTSRKGYSGSVVTLTKVVSRVISARPPIENPGPPPDAGLVAWGQAAMCHL